MVLSPCCVSATCCHVLQGQAGIIGLHGGLPAGSAFPITSLSFTLRDGTSATIDDPAKVRSFSHDGHLQANACSSFNDPPFRS